MSAASSRSIHETTPTKELDVLVVGAGFAGLYQLDRLRNLGYSVKLYEAGAGLGGVWHWNHYPGARVDTYGPLYQFSREDLWRDWNWEEFYPSWKELRKYFSYVDEKLDLSRDIRFNTRVSAADFDQETAQWNVRTDDGHQVKARFVVLCTGFAAKPYTPDIPGLNDFKGTLHHTARWPDEDVDFKGKRVAIIGTGASGVQVAQEVSKEAAQLTIFQRTPILALPMRQQKLDEETQTKWKLGYAERFGRRADTFAGFDFDFIPKSSFDVSDKERLDIFEDMWSEGGFPFWLGAFHDMLFDQKANDEAYAFWRDKTRMRIKDPALAEKLAPTEAPHPFGCKRPSLEQWYYEIFNQDNVSLVDLNDTPIERITETGLKTSDAEHQFDIIVMATGFDSVTGGLTSIDFHGTDGQTLKQKWSQGVRTHLGVATAGFPNLLFVYGPQSPSGFCNGPTCAELQGDLIIDCIEHMRTHGLKQIEATRDAEESWRKHNLEAVDDTLFPLAKSWYMGANIPGKPVEILNYPGGLPLYFEKFKECVEQNFSGFKLR